MAYQDPRMVYVLCYQNHFWARDQFVFCRVLRWSRPYSSHASMALGRMPLISVRKSVTVSVGFTYLSNTIWPLALTMDTRAVICFCPSLPIPTISQSIAKQFVSWPLRSHFCVSFWLFWPARRFRPHVPSRQLILLLLFRGGHFAATTNWFPHFAAEIWFGLYNNRQVKIIVRHFDTRRRRHFLFVSIHLAIRHNTIFSRSHNYSRHVFNCPSIFIARFS